MTVVSEIAAKDRANAPLAVHKDTTIAWRVAGQADFFSAPAIVFDLAGRPVAINEHARLVLSQLTAAEPQAPRADGAEAGDLRRNVLLALATSRQESAWRIVSVRSGNLVHILRARWSAIVDAPELSCCVFSYRSGRRELDIEAARDVFRLTRREAEVAVCLCEGMAVREISRRCEIAEATVRVHVKRIFSKIHVNTQPQLMRKLSQFEI